MDLTKNKNLGSIVTDIGIAMIANGVVLGEKIDLKKFGVGDGAGTSYQPIPSMTELKNELWRGNISDCKIKTDSPNTIEITLIIPHTVGDFTIREIGIFNNSNQLIAICNTPDIEKIKQTNNIAMGLRIIVGITVSNTDIVTFDEKSIPIILTKKELEKHNQSLSAHADKAQKDLTNVTATSVLEKVKVVDGNGSGLDADTVDGKHASDFKLALKNGNYFLSNFGDTGITLGNGDNATFEACNMDIQSWYGIGIKPAAPSSSDIGRTIVINARNGEIKTKGQIYVDTNKKIWHEGNDGSGSGLDADTVDGKHAADLQNYNNLTNKPTIPTTLPANGGNSDTVDGKHAVDLQNYNNLTNKPVIPTTLPANGGNADTVDGKHAVDLQNYNNLTNKPDLKAVATSGNYNDLSNKLIVNTQLIDGYDKVDFDGCNVDIKSWYGLGILSSCNNPEKIRSIIINARNGDIKTKGQIYVDTDKKVWHEGNDGSGSGLDADTVDGKHAAVLYSNCSAAAPTSYLGDNVQYQVY